MKKSIKIFVTVLSLVLLFTACGQSKTDTSNETENNVETAGSTEGEKEYRDAINIAMTAQPPTLDATLTASNASLNVAGNIFEQLYAMNENYEPVPELAESYTVSDDGLEYTFVLRKGVKFHNGNEMTVDDVVASMNRWLDVSARAKILFEGAKFEKVDDSQVKFTVATPTSDVMIILANRTLFPVVMPKEVVEAATAEGVSEYIGTGPYKFQEWKQDQYIHLIKNEDYTLIDSEPSGFSGRKEALTENLYYFFVVDHATRIAGVKTGEYDVAEDVPLENYDELTTAPGVIAFSRARGSLNAFFNTKQGILTNPTMRQAVLAAMNDNEIMLGSYASEKNFVLDPGYMNINQPQWAVKSGEEYYNQNNPEKAKELLTEAGYNGETIRLLTTKDYQEMYAATIVLQEQLRQAGINAEVSSFDFPTFMEKRTGRTDWDIFITSNGYNVIPPQILAVNPDWAGFDEPQVAEYIKGIRSAKTPEEAKAEWEKLQQFMYEFASSTAIGHYNSAMATTDKVEGMVYFDTPIYWNATVQK